MSAVEPFPVGLLRRDGVPRRPLHPGIGAARAIAVRVMGAVGDRGIQQVVAAVGAMDRDAVTRIGRRAQRKILIRGKRCVFHGHAKWSPDAIDLIGRYIDVVAVGERARPRRFQRGGGIERRIDGRPPHFIAAKTEIRELMKMCINEPNDRGLRWWSGRRRNILGMDEARRQDGWESARRDHHGSQRYRQVPGRPRPPLDIPDAEHGVLSAS